MQIDREFTAELVRRVLSVTSPDRIVLFGSAATDQMTADSDVDVLILESAPANTRGESVLVRRALRGLGRPLDVVIMKTERFEQTKHIVGGLAYPAHKYGRTLYAANPAPHVGTG